MRETASVPQSVDLVTLFLEIVECTRPPTPAVVVEHPDQLLIVAPPEALQALLCPLVQAAIKDASERAEIRLELGSRPGCSFFLRDNGEALTRDACASHHEAMRMASTLGARIHVDEHPGWGSSVAVLLDAAPMDDGTVSAP